MRSLASIAGSCRFPGGRICQGRSASGWRSTRRISSVGSGHESRTSSSRRASSGHPWLLHDVTSSFSGWLAGQEYRDSYYSDPELLAPALPQFLATLEAEIGATLSAPEADPTSVVALVGVGSLFPMIRVSDLLQRVADRIAGRLLIFFPGSFERGNYRLLDARDGWNYLAIPITIPEGATR